MVITLLIWSLAVTGGLGRVVRHCPEGSVEYAPDDTCIQFFDNSYQYSQAVVACRGVNAEMMTIKTQEKEDFVNGLADVVDTVIWNGVDDMDIDTVWIFHDGTSLGDYTPWVIDPADNPSGGVCSIRTADGKWQQSPCSDNFAYFCESNVITEYVVCDSRWHLTPAADACIKPIKGMRKNFEEAEDRCQELGGSLATDVVSRSQRRHAMSFIGFRGHFWIGVHSPTEDGEFEFLAGAPLGDNPPFKRKGSNGHCVSMKMGRWYSKNCNRRQFFICQKTPQMA